MKSNRIIVFMYIAAALKQIVAFRTSGDPFESFSTTQSSAQKAELNDDDTLENYTKINQKPASLNITSTKDGSIKKGLFFINVTLNPCPQHHKQDKRGKCRKMARVQ
jgi:hypothetical protein